MQCRTAVVVNMSADTERHNSPSTVASPDECELDDIPPDTGRIATASVNQLRSLTSSLHAYCFRSCLIKYGVFLQGSCCLVHPWLQHKQELLGDSATCNL